jgi:hypothetical protein
VISAIQYINLLNDKEFCFSLIGLNSIFSTLPPSEYTSRADSTPRVRYIRACVYFCLLSIRFFDVVQPETRFHFQSANQIAKKGQFCFLKFKIYKKFHKNVRERLFNLKGGYGFFLKKYSDSQCCWKKYSDFGEGKKKKSDSEFLSYNLMLNSGKKIRDKKKKIF